MIYKLSVIVPIYNVDKYLQKCINSILSNNYDNLEVILVDDGSTDKSHKICSDLQEKNKCIKIITKENGGLSSARNAGLEIASGDYISFIDSDDFVDKSMFAEMMKAIVNAKADLVQCCYKRVYLNNRVENSKDNRIYEILEGENIKRGFFIDKKIDVMVWNKIFKRECIKNTKFIEGKNNEDNMYMMDIINNLSKVVILPNIYYYYLYRDNSITKQTFNIKKLDSLNAYHYMIKICEKEKMINYIPYLLIDLCLSAFYLYYDVWSSSLDKIDKDEYFCVIRKEFIENYETFLGEFDNVKMYKKNKYVLKLFFRHPKTSLVLYKVYIKYKSIKSYSK